VGKLPPRARQVLRPGLGSFVLGRGGFALHSQAAASQPWRLGLAGDERPRLPTRQGQLLVLCGLVPWDLDECLRVLARGPPCLAAGWTARS
jgi:hypothetical protein